MKVIKNRDEIVKQLAEFMKQFDKDMNQYQTDVYAYYDEETQEVTIDTFVNVGGRSWKNDNHEVIYIDVQHDEDIFDFFDTVDFLADALGIDEEQLETETDMYFEYESEEYAFCDIVEYVKHTSAYMEKLKDVYNEEIEKKIDYMERAESVISEYESR